MASQLASSPLPQPAVKLAPKPASRPCTICKVWARSCSCVGCARWVCNSCQDDGHCRDCIEQCDFGDEKECDQVGTRYCSACQHYTCECHRSTICCKTKTTHTIDPTPLALIWQARTRA